MSMKMKAFIALAAAMIVTLAAVVPAQADEHTQVSDPTLTVNAGTGPRFDDTNGGSIFPSVSNFNAVTLNGTAQITAATIPPFVIVDDSGTLKGWNLSLTIADFKDGTGAGCATNPTNTLSAATMAMNPPVVAAATADTSMTGVAPHGFSNFTTAQNIVTADAGDGMGSYTVAPQLLKMVVPIDTAAAAYCTLATLAVASLP